jgi:hypothetical protein
VAIGNRWQKSVSFWTFWVFCLIIGFIDNTEALVGIFAPFGTAEIYLRIKHGPPAVSTLQLRLIFKKLYGFSAAGTIDLKDVIGLPKPLVLTWASEHIFGLN